MDDHCIETAVGNIFSGLSGSTKEDSFRLMFEGLQECVVAQLEQEELPDNPYRSLFLAKVLAPLGRLGNGECIIEGLRAFRMLVDVALSEELVVE